MRTVTYLTYKGYTFDVLTQEYNLDIQEWNIRVTYSYEVNGQHNYLNGSGLATAYREAAEKAVLDCIRRGKEQQSFKFDY